MNSRVEKIGRLSLLRDERLESGRYGSVFPGKCQGVDEEVAIKRIKKKDNIRIDSNLYIMAKGQRNIINYYATDYSMSDEFMYLAIEYCMGSLEDLVCGGYGDDFAMTDESHIPVLHQITSGLNQLHSLGIVHGNLKPSNILVSFPKGDTNEPTMKLADFGIRHSVRDEATGLTQFRLVTTEGWMCSTDKQDPISPSFDLFSLGCICGFIILNGRHPFGTDPISGIRNKQPMTLILGRIAPSLLDPYFIDLVAQMMDFDFNKRPSSSDVLHHQIFNQQLPPVILSYQEKEQEEDVTEPLLTTSPYLPIDEAADFLKQHDDRLISSKLPLDWKKQEKGDDIGSSDDSEDDGTANGDVSSYSPPPKKNKKQVARLSNQQPEPPVDLDEEKDHQGRRPNSGKGKSLRPRANASNWNHATAERLIDSQHQPSSVTSSSSSSTSSDDELYDAQPSTSTGRAKKKFNCDICGYCCDFKSQMSQHMITHTGERPFECEICSKTFSRLSNLFTHRKMHFPPQFKCDVCPKMFHAKQDRAQHMNIHTGARPYQCNYCSKTFSHRRNLFAHRKVHFPPQFKCDFCPKMFTYKQVRDIHMYTHTGEKPFKCEQCDESFANPASLSQHRMKHLKLN